MNLAALIPARGSSKRLPGKNTRLLAGHPLIAYTIAAAQQSGVFSQIVVASDSPEILRQCEDIDGRVTVYLRNHSLDTEPDIQWVQQVLYRLEGADKWDAFAILRPTSPFRSAETIRRAWERFGPQRAFWDSLRAVRVCSEHPAKMWLMKGIGPMSPLLLQPEPTPWHSQPTQNLPKVYVQTAGLEIAWVDTVKRTGTIAGERVLAFDLEGPEALDINTEQDWAYAEHLVATGQGKLPEVT